MSEDMMEVVLPFDMLVEIGMSRWWTWGAFRLCNKALYGAMSAIDPYAKFTKRSSPKPETGELWIDWVTSDGTVICSIGELLYSFVIKHWRDGRCTVYSYFDTAYDAEADAKHENRYYKIEYTGIRHNVELRRIIYRFSPIDPGVVYITRRECERRTGIGRFSALDREYYKNQPAVYEIVNR
ncbi:hypothetical protein F-VV57_0497 [Faustovirus]|nr:hypothetical protein F-VV57_0497 [Faustovirus]QJX73765.1 hypothetical protein F-VV63_0499 [Faustovirus]